MSTFWEGKTVFVTGHTGFKGAWLMLMLERLGARPVGFALAPEADEQLFASAGLATRFSGVIGNLRDAGAVRRAMREADPDIVIHMGAQALVRRSYGQPLETFETNVTGTAHLLEALAEAPRCRAALVVTSDKVYRNDDAGRPFRETDPLGGKDPYSASKACAEILTHSYRESVVQDRCTVATARAGNVIGGGDWSEDRLVPDMIRALIAGEPIALRYPDAVRPWQHVLDVNAGYLRYVEHLAMEPGQVPPACNFGPSYHDLPSVRQVAERLSEMLDSASRGWIPAPGRHPLEASLLRLDCGLADLALGWRPRLTCAEAITWTAHWYGRWRDGADPLALTHEQIERYFEPVGRWRP